MARLLSGNGYTGSAMTTTTNCRHCGYPINMTDDLRKAGAACPWCGQPILKTKDELAWIANGQEYEPVRRLPTRGGIDPADERDLTPTERLEQMELTLRYIADCMTVIKGRNDPTSPDWLSADAVRKRCDESLRLYSRK
jgi:hypothetical protein